MSVMGFWQFLNQWWNVALAVTVSGVLTTDPLLDLAFSSAGAVAVWRGARDRTMSPTTYPSIPIPTTNPISFAVSARATTCSTSSSPSAPRPLPTH